MSERLVALVTADDHGFIGELVPAIDLLVSNSVISNLEMRHHGEQDDEADHKGRVAEPQQVVAALSIAGGFLHAMFQIFGLTFDETGL